MAAEFTGGLLAGDRLSVGFTGRWGRGARNGHRLVTISFSPGGARATRIPPPGTFVNPKSNTRPTRFRVKMHPPDVGASKDEAATSAVRGGGPGGS
jgi:hypothetical protein